MDNLGESVQCLADMAVGSVKAEVCVKTAPTINRTKSKVIPINQQNYKVPQKSHD